VAGEGFEPSKAKPTDLQDVARSALTRINGVDIRAQGTNRARTAATTTRGDDRAGDGLVHPMRPVRQARRPPVGHPHHFRTRSRLGVEVGQPASENASGRLLPAGRSRGSTYGFALDVTGQEGGFS